MVQLPFRAPDTYEPNHELVRALYAATQARNLNRTISAVWLAFAGAFPPLSSQRHPVLPKIQGVLIDADHCWTIPHERGPYRGF